MRFGATVAAVSIFGKMKRGGLSRSDWIVDSDVEGVGQFFESVDGACFAPRFDVSDGDPMHAGFSGQFGLVEATPFAEDFEKVFAVEDATNVMVGSRAS